MAGAMVLGRLQMGGENLSQIGRSARQSRSVRLWSASKESFDLPVTVEEHLVRYVKVGALEQELIQVFQADHNVEGALIDSSKSLRIDEADSASQNGTSLLDREGEIPGASQTCNTNDSAESTEGDDTLQKDGREENAEPVKRRKKKRNLTPEAKARRYCLKRQIEIVNRLIENEELEKRIPVPTIMDAWAGVMTRLDLMNVLRNLEACNKYSLIMEIFCWMWDHGGYKHLPKSRICNMLLKILGRAGMIEQAEEVFQLTKGLMEDAIRLYHGMMVAYFEVGQAEKAMDVYRNLQLEGMDPNKVTYEILIERGVEKLFTEVESHDLKPDFHLYNFVVDVLTGKGEEDSCVRRLMILENFEPNLLSFNKKLSECSNIRDTAMGMRLLVAMTNVGVEPDVVSYTIVIQMFNRCRMYKEAIEIFRLMKDRGCKPNAFTYNLLVSVFGRAGMVKQAQKLFCSLQMEGYRVHISAYSALISAYLHEGMFLESDKLFARMEASGVKADMCLLNTIANAYMNAGMVSRALELLHGKGFSLNKVSYKIKVEALLRLGLVDQAAAAYEEMRAAYGEHTKLSHALNNALRLR